MPGERSEIENSGKREVAGGGTGARAPAHRLRHPPLGHIWAPTPLPLLPRRRIEGERFIPACSGTCSQHRNQVALEEVKMGFLPTWAFGLSQVPRKGAKRQSTKPWFRASAVPAWCSPVCSQYLQKNKNKQTKNHINSKVRNIRLIWNLSPHRPWL